MPRKNEFKTDASPELGYLLGATLSDGSIWCNITKVYGYRQYRLQFDQIDREMVEEVNRCLSVITGRTYTISTYVPKNKPLQKPGYRLMAFGQDFIPWLLEVTKMKTRIPDFWRVSSREFKLRLLAGLLDGDGWIQEKKTKAGTPIYYAGLVSTDAWLDDAEELANSLGIRSYPKEVNRQYERQSGEKRTVYAIRLRTSDLSASGIVFAIKRKQERLERLRAFLESSETLRLPLAKGAR